MFQCGNQVMYGVHGICKIVDIETKKIGSQTTEYYVLEPIDQTNSRFYVPTHNEAAVAKLRPILSQKEIIEILHSADVQNDAWIQDETQRKQRYTSLITGGDRAALVRMVHALHKHKNEQATLGRKLHMCDENFLRDAERLLGAEFSLVLNIAHNEVGKYVQSIIESE